MIEFDIDIGAGARHIAIDPEDITLGFLNDIQEAQASDQWAPLMRAIGVLLKLSDDEVRAITIRQFKRISAALQESVKDQTAIPNG